ncbi:MAG: nucleotidyltransferase domain-containing protein [Acidimicrobiia bacterium]|nr:nucleotidyltransferase domain-containing protein [Acidimicrobiia bacterium]
MTLTRSDAPPCLDDARRAAAALAEAGGGRVLLYGSLARGTQTPDSDIDLLAIFDNLDYSTRWKRKVELEGSASRASRRPVEVHVTDRPEWAVRSERLATSFERAVAAEAVVLHDAPPGDVDWNKEIGLPDSDRGEAEASLRNAVQALVIMETHAHPGPGEQGALADGDADHFRLSVTARLRGLCAQAQVVLENSLKALVHLYGSAPPPRTHELGRLAALLPAAERALARDHLAGIDPHAVSEWREKGTYVADFPDVALADLPTLAHSFAMAACGVARLAADRAGADRIRAPRDEPTPARTIAKLTAAIEEALAGWNLAADPVDDLIGSLDVEPEDDIDAIIYGLGGGEPLS